MKNLSHEEILEIYQDAYHEDAITCGLWDLEADTDKKDILRRRDNLKRTIGSIEQRLDFPTKSVAQIASEAGWNSGEFFEDWPRIVSSIISHRIQFNTAKRAICEQVEYEKKRQSIDPCYDPFISKSVSDDACAFCRKSFLTERGIPRVERLSVLLLNKSNWCKDPDEWKPTVGPCHIDCRCTLNIIPRGFVFNTEGDLVPCRRAKKMNFKK